MTKLVKMAPKVEVFEGRTPNEIAWAKRLPPEALNKARMLQAVSYDVTARRQAQSDEQIRLAESIRAVEKQIRDIDRYAEAGGAMEKGDHDERAELVAELQEMRAKAKELREQANQPSLVFGVEKFWQLYEDDPRTIFKHKVGEYNGGKIPAALQSGLPTVRKKIAAKEAERQSALGADLPLNDQLAQIKRTLVYWGNQSKFNPHKTKRYHRTHRGYAQADPGRLLGRETSGDMTAADVLAFICSSPGYRAMRLKEWEVELRANHDPRTALSIQQREEKAAQLSTEILELERTEEEIVMHSLRAGIAVERRPGANILAVLEIEIDPNAKRAVRQEFGGTLLIRQAGDPESEATADFDFG